MSKQSAITGTDTLCSNASPISLGHHPFVQHVSSMEHTPAIGNRAQSRYSEKLKARPLPHTTWV